MGYSTFANLRSSEGTVVGEEIITFNMRVGSFTILNDSATKDLQFKFNAGEDYARLLPTETISFEIRTRTIYLNGNSVDYRIIGVG